MKCGSRYGHKNPQSTDWWLVLPRSFLFVAVITDLSWWYDMFTEQVLFLGAHVFAPSNCNMRTRPEYIITTRSTIMQAHRWMFKLLIYIFSSIQLHDWKVWRQQARNIKKCLLLTWSEKSMAFLPSHISGSFSFAWKDSAWRQRSQKEAMTGCQSRWIVSLQTKKRISPHSSPLPTCWTSEVQINWIPNLKSSKVHVVSPCFTLPKKRTSVPSFQNWTPNNGQRFIFSPPQSGGIPARS